MHALTQNPAAAYRKVDLDARIEASGGADLTRICLEEAIAALHQAELACANGANNAAREPLSRAHAIALWLARSVAGDNPLREALVSFYGGLAATIRENMARPDLRMIAHVRIDLRDVLEASGGR